MLPGCHASSGQTVLITGARAPVALHHARLFHAAGWRVVLADMPARPVSRASRACALYQRLPSPRFHPEDFTDALEALIEREKPSLIVPTCEEVFYLAAIRERRGLGAELFAPGLDLLQTSHNKHDFIKLCERLGIAVPETRLLTSREDVTDLGKQAESLVFKPVWSRFAGQVLVSPASRKLTQVVPSAAMPWVAQERLEGDEISAYVLARDGKVLAVSMYRSLYRAGAGAGICFEPVTDPAARAFTETFVGNTGWTGQVSFDLMRLEDGSVRPLECNPRATSGLHFFKDAARFVRTLLQGGDEVLPDVTDIQAVRLAMWVYGLPSALRSRDFAHFREVLGAAEEILRTEDDPAPGRAQIPALLEIAAIAMRNRISLQSATTRDIEWNGPDQSSM
ncbi:ATP-grasp domain-containing protein [Labrenzia sp. R5_0]|jgi:predicted ATP-grasp superfamily ATP-dependent carboligase|uniref:ATP-grasp domain-containing protein n=1 Tax=Labrenzia sp. R5_0 TaxID=2821108 RepID=UPI001ADD355D|nr:ATP-grasp domain-containing protein [Labrenzia sp. R5_0]MBO9460648.1 ATP-grasp domain-containing protein [Labrenzia sp. R5_0]